MRISYSIDDLRSELIGIVINWLTVIDVYKNKNNRTVCLCKCKCGTVKEFPIKTIRKGRIKSCGCFHKSKEFSDNCKKWCKDNKDKVKERAIKYKQWCESNSDKVAEQGIKHSQWFKESTSIIDDYRNRMTSLNIGYNKEHFTYKRIESIKAIIEENSDIINKIHKDDLSKLLSGNITASDHIRTACPCCGKFSEHNVRDIFNISDHKFKRFRLCDVCFSKFSSSAYEDEIAEYISSFYNGKYVTNDKSIISPFELDLYYPEKNIAIEFNGDYWHSSLFKDEHYHYNKLKKCLENGITLVHVFESYWHLYSYMIKSYIRDLFDNKVNILSFTKICYINNNYPPPNIDVSDINYIEDYYTFKDSKVYTAGLSDNFIANYYSEL